METTTTTTTRTRTSRIRTVSLFTIYMIKSVDTLMDLITNMIGLTVMLREDDCCSEPISLGSIPSYIFVPSFCLLLIESLLWMWGMYRILYHQDDNNDEIKIVALILFICVLLILRNIIQARDIYNEHAPRLRRRWLTTKKNEPSSSPPTTSSNSNLQPRRPFYYNMLLQIYIINDCKYH